MIGEIIPVLIYMESENMFSLCHFNFKYI